MRNDLNVLLLVCRALNDQTPEYMKDMLQERISFRILRSTISSQLGVPRSRLKDLAVVLLVLLSMRLWNALPGSTTDCKSTGDFKKGFKTHLFKSAFN